MGRCRVGVGGECGEALIQPSIFRLVILALKVVSEPALLFEMRVETVVEGGQKGEPCFAVLHVLQQRLLLPRCLVDHERTAQVGIVQVDNVVPRQIPEAETEEQLAPAVEA